MDTFPLILICAPTNEVKRYCQFRWIDQVMDLSYPNYLVYLCDNSPTEDFSNEIRKTGVICDWINPEGKRNMQYMAESHEMCRKKAISIGAKFMIHWEVDLFNDDKACIENLLMRFNHLMLQEFTAKFMPVPKYAPLLGGLYHIKEGKKSYLCLINKSSRHIAEGAISTHILEGGADMMVVDGNFKELFHVGLGYTLIHKSVFEKISFRFDEREIFHPDSSFAEDLYYLGGKVYADTSLLLKHENSKWIHYN